ncbi:adenylosuccinate synthetase [Candidatus Aenigmatarchaeota archaeon]
MFWLSMLAPGKNHGLNNGTMDFVTGIYWGDGGKGRVIDELLAGYDMTGRAAGSDNAGHTVVVDGQEYITHSIPVGVLRPGMSTFMGNGVVWDLDRTQKEISYLKGLGVSFDPIYVSGASHIMLHHYQALEAIRESGDAGVGSTKKAVSISYEAKAARTGIRAEDLNYPERLKEAVRVAVEDAYPKLVAHRDLLRKRGFSVPRDPIAYADQITEHLLSSYDELRSDIRITNTGNIIAARLRKGERFLGEGAQGAGLDIDHGTYPNVTSSNTTIGGMISGLGVGPIDDSRRIGVLKAYPTRVGNGPMPTLMEPELDEYMRTKGNEFGATTGRERRSGWPDMVQANHARDRNNLTDLVIPKIDVLSGLPSIKICTAYRLRDGSEVDFMPPQEELERATPIYGVEIDGWDENISGVTKLDDLPKQTLRYLDAIEDLTQTPIMLATTGKERGQTVWLRT